MPILAQIKDISAHLLLKVKQGMSKVDDLAFSSDFQCKISIRKAVKNFVLDRTKLGKNFVVLSKETTKLRDIS